MGLQFRTALARIALAGTCATLACGDAPPDLAETEPLEFEAAATGLPPLSDLCGPRGRLFAVGRDADAGVVLEEGPSGLVAVPLEESFPPQTSCWQSPSAELVSVGHDVALERSPEGEWQVRNVLGDANGALLDVVGTGSAVVVAAGQVDGFGALFQRTSQGWSRIDLADLAVAPLESITVDTQGTFYAVGSSAAVAWRADIGARQLPTGSDRLSAIAAYGDDVYAVSLDGQVLRLVDGALVSTYEIGARLTDVEIDATGDLWIAGQGGMIARHTRLPSSTLVSTARIASTPATEDIAALEATRSGIFAIATGSSTELWQLVD